jgi:hypothetical protein
MAMVMVVLVVLLVAGCSGLLVRLLDAIEGG